MVESLPAWIGNRKVPPLWIFKQGVPGYGASMARPYVSSSNSPILSITRSMPARVYHGKPIMK